MNFGVDIKPPLRREKFNVIFRMKMATAGMWLPPERSRTAGFVFLLNSARSLFSRYLDAKIILLN